MPEPTNREKEIFGEALEMGSPEARLAYVNGACGADRALRERVEVLLKAYEAASGFIPTRSDLDGEIPTVTGPARLTEGPGTVIDRYKLLQIIGEGGMGVVHMAEQEEPVRRRVALKIIKLGMDTRQVVARFEAERQALALMDHPNIARVLDGGATETGRPYFVMELVQGVPITQFCDKNKLTAQERMRLFIQVCQAIQSAHQKGIIHRDIKPSNVLVTLHHGEPMPKVIDFGIAKATNQKLTEKTLFTNHATMIGTPAYMSPEQAEMTSMDVDTRTDVYALGVLLYELLTGSTPFPEKRLRSLGYGEMQRVIVDEEPDRPSTRLSTMADEQKSVVAKNRGEELASLSKLLRGDLDWVVMRCLEKDRRRRYDTPNELVADIERHLKNEPVIARPPTVGYRFQKMVQRNKLVFAAAGAVAAALIIGLGASTWLFLKERDAHAFLETQRKVIEQARVTAVGERMGLEISQKVAEEQRAVSEENRRKAEEKELETHRNLYAAHMKLAQSALESNNPGRALNLLERHRPKKGEPDLRGWEWRYLWRLSRSVAAAIQLGSVVPKPVEITFRNLPADLKVWPLSTDGRAWSLSPDGQRLFLMFGDDSFTLWDLQTWQASPRLPLAATNFSAAALLPGGTIVALGGAGGAMKLHDAATMRELAVLTGFDSEVTRVACSTDGKILVAECANHLIKAWETATRREITNFTVRGKISSTRLPISQDGRRVLTPYDDGTTDVWELPSGRRRTTFSNQKNEILGAYVFRDGKRVATCNSDKTAALWDLETQRPIITVLSDHGMLSSIAPSPDERRLIAGDDKKVMIWDIASQQEVAELPGHTRAIVDLAFWPDGNAMVSVSKDVVHVWRAASFDETDPPLAGAVGVRTEKTESQQNQTR